MTNMSVFWVCPIMTLVFTWFFTGWALIKPYPVRLLYLAMIVGWHVWTVFNHDNLQSLFHGGDRHIGYYRALHEFGGWGYITFNYFLLLIDGLFFIIGVFDMKHVIKEG